MQQRFGEASQEYQIAMAQLYLFNAVEKINSKGKEAIISFTEGDEQRRCLWDLSDILNTPIYQISLH